MHIAYDDVFLCAVTIVTGGHYGNNVDYINYSPKLGRNSILHLDYTD